MIYAMRYNLMVDKEGSKDDDGRYPAVEGTYVMTHPDWDPMEYKWKNIEEFGKKRADWAGNIGFMCGGFVCVDSRVRYKADNNLPFFLTLMRDDINFEEKLELPFIREHDEEVRKLKSAIDDMWMGWMPECTERFRKFGLEWNDEESFVEARGEGQRKLYELLNKYSDHHPEEVGS